jgi:hypothetical protein
VLRMVRETRLVGLAVFISEQLSSKLQDVAQAAAQQLRVCLARMTEFGPRYSSMRVDGNWRCKGHRANGQLINILPCGG